MSEFWAALAGAGLSGALAILGGFLAASHQQRLAGR
jgi:hypothetical protein